jgi:hypothetical protein
MKSSSYGGSCRTQGIFAPIQGRIEPNYQKIGIFKSVAYAKVLLCAD